ncbi:DUF4238 domain-containing protein [Acinetobacter towneri]|uniref:DUF4238 domain-containing protein n=1 Tax=Acinetobacter towneri TaxID=202956 RepID=UPI0025751FD3|nr:DUF4238 domain-containing protein [Acinetobacter towneri]MDM1282785.1 DUF4238 domain-containing protein [Acinetobacter towneri]
MAAKKNQHYVPQYYFRYFNDKQKFISLLLVNDKRIINKCSISDQSSLPYFYGDSEVEDKICIIENSNRIALNKFQDEKIIDKQQKKAILECILFQHSRTAKSRQLMKSAWQTIEAFTDFHHNVSNEREAKKWLQQNDLKSFEVNEKQWHLRQLSMLKNASWQLSDLDYLILNNKSELDFVFSDAPVVYLNPFMVDFKEKGITGTLSKGLIAAYPVSNKLLILLFERKVYNFDPLINRLISKNKTLDADVELVKYFNYLQFLNAESCVYSNQKESLEILKERSGRVTTKFTCNIELKNEGENNAGVLFSGALDQTPNFPPPPFFYYKIAKKFLESRQKSQQNYKKLNEKRFKRLLSEDGIKQLSKAKSFDEIFSIFNLTI